MKSSQFLIPILLALSATNATAQQDWLQDWRDATVAIGVIDTGKAINKQTGRPILKPNGDTSTIPYLKVKGTGVILGSPDTSIKIPFLVTAKHVICDPKNNWIPCSIQLRFSWFADKSVGEYTGFKIRLTDDSGRALWIPHPDRSVDLAAIPLFIPKQAVGRPNLVAVPLSITASNKEAFEGASVLVFGYPGAVGPDYWTKPIIRHGIVAHIDQTRFGQSPILIDAMIYPGNSGGPVFTVPSGMAVDGSFSIGGRSAFLGIVSAVARQSVDVEKASFAFQSTTTDSSAHFKSFEYMGLGIIEPAQRVRELLDQITK